MGRASFGARLGRASLAVGLAVLAAGCADTPVTPDVTASPAPAIVASATPAAPPSAGPSEPVVPPPRGVVPVGPALSAPSPTPSSVAAAPQATPSASATPQAQATPAAHVTVGDPAARGTLVVDLRNFLGLFQARSQRRLLAFTADFGRIDLTVQQPGKPALKGTLTRSELANGVVEHRFEGLVGGVARVEVVASDRQGKVIAASAASSLVAADGTTPADPGPPMPFSLPGWVDAGLVDATIAAVEAGEGKVQPNSARLAVLPYAEAVARAGLSVPHMIVPGPLMILELRGWFSPASAPHEGNETFYSYMRLYIRMADGQTLSSLLSQTPFDDGLIPSLSDAAPLPAPTPTP